MNLTLIRQLAWRYLRGKRSANAVPILSRISMVAIGVGAAAMIILFSVFNGFEGLVKDLYTAFYPEIKITPAKGKFYSLDKEQFAKLEHLEGVQVVSRVLEDKVLLNSSSEEHRVATLKGVDANYFKVNNVASYITEGTCTIATTPVHSAVIGSQLAGELGVDVNNVFSTMEAYYPNPKISASEVAQAPERAFRSLMLRPDGAFTIQDDFDGEYVIADIGLMQDLVQEPGRYSSLELLLYPGADADDVSEQIHSLLGDKYIVQTRFEQNKTLYVIMRTEKWAVYAILVLVLMIAAFNMVGALSLLVLEKQKDIGILKAMGARNGHVSGIFLSEGALWSLLGGGTGLALGILICLGQQKFGWLKLGGAFIIEAYPIRLYLTDIVVVLATILAIGLLAAWFPAARANRVTGLSLKSD
ncbi:MAG: ABC transporter permease [Chitinophagaceae bacterium]|nr:ABC transporter permease [Chitinophagaceae bacterium]MCB9045726.1 ABC transporter permease [Chitinophagales bacterium]